MTVAVQWLDLDEAGALADEWTDLTDRTGADTWFTASWIAAWGRHFAVAREIQVLSARRDGSLVAMLPFVFDTIRPFGFPIRVAQLAGVHPLFAVLTLPIEGDLVEDLIVRALDELISIHRRDCVSFAPISEYHHLSVHLAAAFDSSDKFVHSDTRPRSHTVIPLPRDFDEYLNLLSRNRRQKYRKTKRDLEEKHGVKTRVLAGQEAAERLDDFIDMHNRQWRTKGRRGHFADWPGSAEFYSDYSRTAPSGPHLFLQETDAEDIVSALFCFTTPKSCFALVPARSENWARSRLDIGLHAQFERIEYLIGQGVSVIETGAGQYDYKSSLKGETRVMHRFLMARNSTRGRIGASLLRRYANTLDVVYYRVWYNRIAPKLRRAGLNPGPLWQSWIRSRV